MASDVADPPAPPAARSRPAASGRFRAGLAVYSPILAAAAALALHLTLSDERLPPLWMESLPAWKHPYTVVLGGILAGSFALLAAYRAWEPARPWVRHVTPLLAGATAVLAVWDAVTLKFDLLTHAFFPGPDEVFGAIVEDRGILAESAWHSLRLQLTGYGVGVFAGLTTGVLVGWFPRFRYWAMPALKLIGPIPATALIPLVMTIWKDSFACAVALIGFAVWFPMTILTSSGIASVRLSYLDVARTLGAGPAFLVFRVAIPAALPHIFVGLFMGLGASFLTLVVAETVGVQAGLGWYLAWQKGYMDYAKMYAALLITALFFSALMTLLFLTRDRVLRWQKGVIKW